VEAGHARWCMYICTGVPKGEFSSLTTTGWGIMKRSLILVLSVGISIIWIELGYLLGFPRCFERVPHQRDYTLNDPLTVTQLVVPNAAASVHFELPKLLTAVPAILEISDEELASWLKTFKARVPEEQEFCLNAFSAGVVASQFSQDTWLFHNVFKAFVVSGKKGFYVDSGANHYRELSNTFFLDVCLGWDGLCVEPVAQYHENIRKYRSCVLIPECIAAKKSNMNLVGGGATTGVTPGGDVKCSSLEDMLTIAPGGARTHVDFWSLDVEGFELDVLQGVDFRKVSFSAILIEDFWVSQRRLDFAVLNAPGSVLVKVLQMPIDSLYVSRETLKAMPTEFWYPTEWGAHVKMNDEFRETVRDRLQC
jgi:Methyltransferase FkbM domain